MPMEKTFNAAEAEARLSAAWEAAGCFSAGAGARRDDTFCVMIPPPNVTGSLHMGHAFNNTLQDILVRWHRMRGFDTLWQPGTDHAGIATQMVVERELAAQGKPPRRDMARDAFIDLVWQQKQKSRGNIIGQLKRLGASCDWDREAFTMAGAPGDPGDTAGGQNFHDAVIKVFVDMYHKGLIYRGKRLVNWDPHFETAISDLEVENIETPGFMWHFKYPLAGGATYEYVEKDGDGQVTLRETRDYISIATTRPETMLGDGAVAVHPSDERYAPIVGQLCEIPVGPKEHRRLIPIIADDYPDPDFGSGAVKITGAHDFNDYEVAKRGGIPMYRLMDTKGAMRDDGEPYAEAARTAMEVAQGERTLTEAEADAVNLVPDGLRGLDRFEARKKVVEQITAEGLAVMVPNPAYEEASDRDGDQTDAPEFIPLVEAKPIMQPFGDRSKVVIEPMLTDQWFVDAAKIVRPAIEAVRNGTTKILPERDAKVYFHWLENIEPWCISRQLWWGHQVPVWYCAGRFEGREDGVPCDFDAPVAFCAPTFEEAAKLAKHYFGPVTPHEVADIHEAQKAWEDGAGVGRDILGEDAPEEDLGYRQAYMWRDPDVLDTWFSSGLWPLGTLGWPEDTPEVQKYFPTSTLITGFDIIFFWVARMMMMQTAVLDQDLPLEKCVPFDTVYVHALVRDEKGKKMSKSLGNVIDPLELIDEYGADAVRFTLAAMAAMGRDLKLSTQRVAGYRNFTTKLWNAVRFAEMNQVYPVKVDNCQRPTGCTASVNRWIIAETAKTRAEVDAALGQYRFNDAANALYAFVWGKVCDWYVEFSKPLFDTEAAEETRATMAWVLEQCLKMLHPFMPFITEELWALTGDRRALLPVIPWPEDDPAALADPEAEEEMSWAIAMIEAVRSARAQMNVPAGLWVPVVRLDTSDAAKASWERNEAMIKRLARIEGLTDAAEAPKGAISITTPGASFALPLAEIIDVDKEKERLAKALGKLEKELGGLKGRLNNPKFVESAPEEVVEEARANLAARQEEEAQLKTALDRLSEIS